LNKLWQLAFRNLGARKTRTLATALGILLGVAAMFAVSVMGASTAQSLKDFFAQSSGRANLTITDAGTSGEGFPRRTLAHLQADASILEAVGITSKSALLQTKDKSIPLTLIGIDPEADARVRTYKIARRAMPANAPVSVPSKL
jgi:ABC-type lipoprotein release transport system permease subunit